MIRNDAKLRGRGAHINTDNKYAQQAYCRDDVEGIDDWDITDAKTAYIKVFPKTIVNEVKSPDTMLHFSANPYQGCEHGCIYCYARNSFEYWGYSAGTDFEQKILIKEAAPQLFKAFLDKKSWRGEVIFFSGNTDCYQPAEKKFRLTRQMLEIAAQYNQPISLITKNSLVCRDIDIISEMAAKNLTMVWISLTGTDDEIRRVLEPRTASYAQRIRTIERLTQAGIPVGVMAAPIIPGINDHQIAQIAEAAANAGAQHLGYTFVRLNGAVATLFNDWLSKSYPDRADKIRHLIESGHAGKLNDSRFGIRMKGEGAVADLVKAQVQLYANKYQLNKNSVALDTSLFRRPGAQLSLFDFDNS